MTLSDLLFFNIMLYMGLLGNYFYFVLFPLTPVKYDYGQQLRFPQKIITKN